MRHAASHFPSRHAVQPPGYRPTSDAGQLMTRSLFPWIVASNEGRDIALTDKRTRNGPRRLRPYHASVAMPDRATSAGVVSDGATISIHRGKSRCGGHFLSLSLLNQEIGGLEWPAVF